MLVLRSINLARSCSKTSHIHFDRSSFLGCIQLFFVSLSFFYIASGAKLSFACVKIVAFLFVFWSMIAQISLNVYAIFSLLFPRLRKNKLKLGVNEQN